VLSVGDTIQGLNDATAEPEWRAWEALVAPWHRVPIHLAAGNHDIWSAASAELFRKHAGSAEHYSFDYGPTHFTVLDNSRSEALSDGEMAFLEADLKAHAGQPINFVISHRPSWIIDALVRHPDFPFHRLMRRYGVRYVVAGHIHEMLHYSLEGVEYISMASAGGHLRSSGKYEDGWFFGYASVDVRGTAVAIQIHELNGRTTPLEAWGPAGLVSREK
jgi:predicted MPP superfamily phosphohydrolase